MAQSSKQDWNPQRLPRKKYQSFNWHKYCKPIWFVHKTILSLLTQRNQLWSWVDIWGCEYMQYVVDIRHGSIRHVVSGILAVAPLSPPKLSNHYWPRILSGSQMFKKDMRVKIQECCFGNFSEAVSFNAKSLSELHNWRLLLLHHHWFFTTQGKNQYSIIFSKIKHFEEYNIVSQLYH